MYPRGQHYDTGAETITSSENDNFGRRDFPRHWELPIISEDETMTRSACLRAIRSCEFLSPGRESSTQGITVSNTANITTKKANNGVSHHHHSHSPH